MWSQQHCRPGHWKRPPDISTSQTNMKKKIKPTSFLVRILFGSLTHWACRSSQRRKPRRAVCGCYVSLLLTEPHHWPVFPDMFQHGQLLPWRTPPDTGALLSARQRFDLSHLNMKDLHNLHFYESFRMQDKNRPTLWRKYGCSGIISARLFNNNKQCELVRKGH